MSAAIWEEQLTGHPDRVYCAYLVKGLKDGCRIGFNYEGHTCSGAVHNMQSVTSQACVVDEYLTSEVKAGRVLRPVPQE